MLMRQISFLELQDPRQHSLKQTLKWLKLHLMTYQMNLLVQKTKENLRGFFCLDSIEREYYSVIRSSKYLWNWQMEAETGDSFRDLSGFHHYLTSLKLRHSGMKQDSRKGTLYDYLFYWQLALDNFRMIELQLWNENCYWSKSFFGNL